MFRITKARPKVTPYSGTDCSGTGSLDATLTHTKNAEHALISIGGTTLMKDLDYTVSGAVFTFVGIVVEDSDKLQVFV